MSDTKLIEQVARLLANTARAHHAATGGVTPGWSRWYAEHLVDDVNDLLRTDVEASALETWLTDADRRYREESGVLSWPKAYAGWLITELQASA